MTSESSICRYYARILATTCAMVPAIVVSSVSMAAPPVNEYNPKPRAVKTRVEQVRRHEPAKTPDWVNRIPGKIGNLLIQYQYCRDGEVWGLAKRGHYDPSPYDEVGSLVFYRAVKQHNLWDRLPKLDEDMRQKTLQFWQSWQDPKTGEFKDPRDINRVVNVKYVLELIDVFGGKPLYPMVNSTQVLAKDASGKIDPTRFLQRTKDDPDWEQGGWGVGSHTGRIAYEMLDAINNGQTDLIPALEQGIEQILSHQNPETGMWGPKTAPLGGQLGGTFKIVGRLYFLMGMKAPHTERLADTLIEHGKNGDWHRAGDSYCIPHNLARMVNYCLEATDYRRDDLLDVLEATAEDYKEWITPDGSMLTRRGDYKSLGYEMTHIDGLRYIALYLHWADCPLLAMDPNFGMYQEFADLGYRPVLRPGGKVKIIDARKPEK